MRLIKLTTDEPIGFTTLDAVSRYFEAPDSIFRSRGRYAMFCFPEGYIRESGLRPGETILFSYEGTVVYAATTWSARMPAPESSRLPYCFEVNVASLRRVSFAVQDLETAIRKTCEEAGVSTKIAATQGWPILPDGVASETIVNALCGGLGQR